MVFSFAGQLLAAGRARADDEAKVADAYRRAKKPDARFFTLLCLLLITGIGANLDMWAPLQRLVTDRELIAFDGALFGTGTVISGVFDAPDPVAAACAYAACFA